MKKVSALFLLLFILNASHGQDVGYNTTDVGAEFQWYEDGMFIGLHTAINAKLHHSFHGEVGYYIAGDPTASYYANQDKGGLGLGLGYRYYTKLRPHAFFIGVKANLFTNRIVLLGTQDQEEHTSKIFLPAFEAGYIILINDLFFITPSVAVGYKTNLESTISLDEKKAVGLFGISLGTKF